MPQSLRRQESCVRCSSPFALKLLVPFLYRPPSKRHRCRSDDVRIHPLDTAALERKSSSPSQHSTAELLQELPITKLQLLLKLYSMQLRPYSASAVPALSGLARVQLDNQLFVDDRLHFFARRNVRDFSFERVAIDGQPIRYRHNLSELEIAQRKLTRFRFVFDRDLVAGFHVERSDVDAAAVNLDVTVRNELAGSVASVGEAEAINYVVEARLKELQKRLAGHTAFAQRVLENPAELSLKKAVLITKFLFLAERDCVIGLFAARTFGAVHSRRIIFPLERLRWSKNLDAVTATDLCFRSGVSAHGRS